MAATMWMPEPESPTCDPVHSGGPSASPVVLMEPPMAWAMGS